MMRGVLTAPMFGTLLCSMVSMSAISAASIKVCISDSDCGPGNFCSNEENPSSCTPCLDCQQLLSRVNTGNCSRESQDCGPCVPGLVLLDDDDESCVEGGEWYSQEDNETGNSTTEETPSEIPLDHDDDVSSIIWIVLGILAVVVLCFLIAGVALCLRSPSRQEDQEEPELGEESIPLQEVVPLNRDEPENIPVGEQEPDVVYVSLEQVLPLLDSPVPARPDSEDQTGRDESRSTSTSNSRESPGQVPNGDNPEGPSDNGRPTDNQVGSDETSAMEGSSADLSTWGQDGPSPKKPRSS